MFGFSRGAFTAKFLARMVNTVGLLCKGNEEMVPFVYKLYQRSLAGKITTFAKGPNKQRKEAERKARQDAQRKAAGLAGLPAAKLTHGEDQHLLDGHEDREHDEGDHEHSCHNDLEAFSHTFCRKEKVDCGHGHTEEQNIKVYFLGLWDCVSSVAVLEQQSPKPVQMAGTAVHVRHAVAVDERRVKFKAALFAQDKKMSATELGHKHDDHDVEDLKEVWFPGCHGDVGGGWPASRENPLDAKKDVGEWSWWDRVKNVFLKRTDDETSQSLEKGPLQMSDIPLAWMIREIELVGKQDPSAAVKWRGDGLKRFKKKFIKRKYEALDGIYHDSLRFGYGSSLGKVLLWKFLEWLPLIKRWEYIDNDWQFIRFPLNMGNTRDIPRGAELHSSLIYRLKNETLNYFPKNNHGEDRSKAAAPCLKHEGKVPDLQPKRPIDSTSREGTQLEEVVKKAGGDKIVLKNDDPLKKDWLNEEDVFHRTWTFCPGDPSG
jgi:hypothetical protein